MIIKNEKNDMQLKTNDSENVKLRGEACEFNAFYLRINEGISIADKLIFY